MSGIFGIVRSPGSLVTDADLAQMAAVLEHRGPDANRHITTGNAGLGHCMLCSTPEALNEFLPLRDEPSGLTITADARIDNREELISKLSPELSGGQVLADSQLILRAYIQWGETCVDHLVGDFAFAIWNERSQTLFVARDHMGCKPFYYHCGQGLFVFASSAMAVASVAGVRATLCEGRVADYLVEELEGINNTCTWYNEIYRMPPAHCGLYGNARFQSRRYWTLQAIDLSHLRTDEDYLSAFTEVYTEAVRCRMRSRTEPASMLSGGLDSATIVALGRDIRLAQGMSPLRTYSAVTGGLDEICAETQNINAVVARGGLNPRFWRFSETSYSESNPLPALAAGEDPFDTVMTVPAAMFMLAAQDGCSALLDGLDGDLAMGLTSAYPSYLLRQGNCRRAWAEVKGCSKHQTGEHRSALTLFLRAMRVGWTPNWARRLKRSVTWQHRHKRILRESFMHPSLSGRINLEGRLREYEGAPGLHIDLRAAHIHALQVPYLTAAIERYERVGSYFGVEARHPLLDKRVLEFSVSLPWWQKASNGWSKILLRRLAEQRLADSVAWHPGCMHLGWRFSERLLHERMQDDQEDFSALQSSLSRFIGAGAPARCSERDDVSATSPAWYNRWKFYCLNHWLRRAFEEYARQVLK